MTFFTDDSNLVFFIIHQYWFFRKILNAIIKQQAKQESIAVFLLTRKIRIKRIITFARKIDFRRSDLLKRKTRYDILKSKNLQVFDKPITTKRQTCMSINCQDISSWLLFYRILQQMRNLFFIRLSKEIILLIKGINICIERR